MTFGQYVGSEWVNGRVCQFCGVFFPYDGSRMGRAPDYCSGRCRSGAFRLRQRVEAMGREVREHPKLAARLRRVFALASEGIPTPER